MYQQNIIFHKYNFESFSIINESLIIIMIYVYCINTYIYECIYYYVNLCYKNQKTVFFCIQDNQQGNDIFIKTESDQYKTMIEMHVFYLSNEISFDIYGTCSSVCQKFSAFIGFDE